MLQIVHKLFTDVDIFVAGVLASASFPGMPPVWGAENSLFKIWNLSWINRFLC